MSPVIEWVFKYAIKLHFLDGYRSYLGGAGFVIGGVAVLLNEAASGVFDDATTQKALASLFAGLTILGHAGKQEKLLAAQGGK